jgi:beta-lactamase regulating signal transducer with metallopeptidase domain
MLEILDLLRRLIAGTGGTAPAWAVLLRVTMLLLAAALVAFALRRSSAALRHMVWTLSLGGALLIPLCYCALPAWQWAILPQRQPATAAAPTATATHDVQASGLPLAPLEEAPAIRLRSAHVPLPAIAPLGETVQDPASAPPAVVADHPSPPAPQASRSPRWSWSFLFAAVWALGTFLGLVWVGAGVAAAWHIARRAKSDADSPWGHLLRPLLDQYGIRRAPEVRQCREVSVPMTWGLFRPVILVPAGSAAWPEEIKRSVLLHELGHIRRSDCLMLLLGRLACVAYWFHPLAWLAVRQLRKTSEQAADDMVLASNIAPPDYAEHLVGIAAKMRGLHLFGHVALPMASPSDLEGRVLAILDPRRNHRSLKRKTCYALMTLAALVLIPCAVLRLGYAEDKQGQEPVAAKKKIPANGQRTDESEALPDIVVAEAKYKVAKAKAEDDINIRYAIAVAQVAKVDFEMNKKTANDIFGSVRPEITQLSLNQKSLNCKERDLAIEKARLDHRIAAEEAKVAKAEFEAAKRPDDRKAQRELQMIEAEARYNVAKARAEDDINVRYAVAAAEVAKADYEISKKAHDAAPTSVSQERLNELLLKCTEAELAIEKTKLDQRIAGEVAKVAKAALERTKRKVELDAGKRKSEGERAPPASSGEKTA